MRDRPVAPRGFTLIELMVAVAIIGLLSSVALPTYQNMQLRSRQTERAVLETSIHRAVDEYWVRESKYPYEWGDGTSMLYLWYDNPDASPRTTKRAWRAQPLNWLDHWNRLSLQIEGAVYYSYRGYAYDFGTTRYQYSWVAGDLDGDGVQNQTLRYWYYTGNRLERWAGGNLSCLDCTYAYEYNRGSF